MKETHLKEGICSIFPLKLSDIDETLLHWGKNFSFFYVIKNASKTLFLIKTNQKTN